MSNDFTIGADLDIDEVEVEDADVDPFSWVTWFSHPDADTKYAVNRRGGESDKSSTTLKVPRDQLPEWVWEAAVEKTDARVDNDPAHCIGTNKDYIEEEDSGNP